jgi:hypothetical protein
MENIYIAIENFSLLKTYFYITEEELSHPYQLDYFFPITKVIFHITAKICSITMEKLSLNHGKSVARYTKQLSKYQESYFPSPCKKFPITLYELSHYQVKHLNIP